MSTTECPSLDVRDVGEVAYAPDEWPIAAAMLQFPGVTPDGRPVTDLAPEGWRELLQPIVDAGFDSLEVPSAWVRLGDLGPQRLREFSAVMVDAELRIPGISVVRESIIHPQDGARNLGFSHRTIDAAAALSVPIVCLGLHGALLPAQRDALWFWTVPGEQKPVDPAVRELAVARYRELAVHAASVGVEISLELYEDSYLGAAVEAVRFLDDIDHPGAGLNPDLGNLIRRQGEVEAWEYLAYLTLPRANYWHVKNYSRAEDPGRGVVLTAPTSLELGIINYRRAVRFAIAAGFSGAFVVEHYGGDGLSVGATNRDYLRRILPRTLVQPAASQSRQTLP